MNQYSLLRQSAVFSLDFSITAHSAQPNAQGTEMSSATYNGIPPLPEWPPRTQSPANMQPMRVPYLEQPPEVIPIDVGRQLFVDDFLIEESHWIRTFHQPAKYPGNPVFYPETPHERNDDLPPCTIPKCGGIWYDPADRQFKMWYMASYLGSMCYAASDDGIHWQRPQLDIVPGTNLILPEHIHPDSGTVWLDLLSNDQQARYKMLLREPDTAPGYIGALMMTSADGIHWSDPVKTGAMHDRSTMFYNPFRRKWVQSIRYFHPTRFRCRLYWEHEDFLSSGNWHEGEPPYWTGADCMDLGGDSPPQLYNLDAVAYESLLIGFHQILKGPPNHVGECRGLPKLTELTFTTSRDGYHWHRPDRNPFIGARREPGSWEYGYIESTGGICLVVGDELWFYYSAYAGDPDRLSKDWHINGTYANGALGLAKLRRDGFASMQARVSGLFIRTRSLIFSGDRLFVNASTSGAALKVECLNRDNQVIDGFSREDCIGFNGNSTCAEIRWQGQENGLTRLIGQPVKFKFYLDKGDLYSFWVTDSPAGASNGYLAAGGPTSSHTIDKS